VSSLATVVDRLRHLIGQLRARFSALGLLVILAVFVLVPVVIENEYYIRVINMIFIYSMLSLGLNVALGYLGEFHFGQAAMYAIGAYTTALLTTRYGVSFPLAFLASIAVPAAASLLIGFPSLRIRGDYLALVTFAFGEIVRIVANSWVSFTRGPMGIPRIPSATFFGVTIRGNVPYYYYGLGLTVFVYLSCYLIVNSHFGRAFLAIREDETAAESLGINTARYKLLAFAVSAFPAGIAGSYLASYLSFIGPTNFTADDSIVVAEAVILGGMASLPGSVLGSAILVIALEVLRPIALFRKAFIGATIILLLVFRPQGLLGGYSIGEFLAKGVRDRRFGTASTSSKGQQDER
jgi:branched-chain amino acid transport system permease protein